MVNFPFVILFPVITYFLSYEFFKNKKAAIFASLFCALSFGLQSIGKQTHEAYVTVFFLALATLFFVRFVNRGKNTDFWLFVLVFFIDLFGYHPTRLWAVYYIGAFFFAIILKRAHLKHLAVFSASVIIFLLSDLAYPMTRVSNLLFFNSEGFKSKVYELQIESKLPMLYNKATVAVKDIVLEYAKYFSPQFLSIDGDSNYRFGYPGMYPLTLVEYVLMLVGLYYLFRNREKWRFFVLALFLFSPLSAALSWATMSLTRSLFIVVAAVIIASYGLSQIKSRLSRYFILLVFFVLTVYNWDFYFFHYPKRALTIRAWQCGYKELGEYVKTNYHRFDRFYITRKNGQPYIFLLFYLNYPPEKYQKNASLSSFDQYGFGQIAQFDKFVFDLNRINENENYAVIGYPDDFNELPENEKNKLQKITVNTEQIFWIKEKIEKR